MKKVIKKIALASFLISYCSMSYPMEIPSVELTEQQEEALKCCDFIKHCKPQAAAGERISFKANSFMTAKNIEELIKVIQDVKYLDTYAFLRIVDNTQCIELFRLANFLCAPECILVALAERICPVVQERIKELEKELTNTDSEKKQTAEQLADLLNLQDTTANTLPSVKGSLKITAKQLQYQCGECFFDLKQRHDLLLPCNPADPLVQVVVRSPESDDWMTLHHPKVGYFPLFLPYCLLADKKENDMVRIFNLQKQSIIELTCQQASFDEAHTSETFENALERLKQEFLKNPQRYSSDCEKKLQALKVMAFDKESLLYVHGPYGFGKVPGSLKDTCIKYILFNKDKLTAEQRAQIKLLPEELREQIEPSTKDEQKP